MKILLIGVGGFLGAISRYLVSEGAVRFFGDKLPFGTFIVNVTGSFILGALLVLSLEKEVVGENMRFLLAVGFLGAFTTFSTFSVESIHLFRSGEYFSALSYITASVVVSLCAAFGGFTVARLWGA